MLPVGVGSTLLLVVFGPDQDLAGVKILLSVLTPAHVYSDLFVATSSVFIPITTPGQPKPLG